MAAGSGSSAREIEVIANIARYHRRAFPKRSHANFAGLSKPDRETVRRLAALLRLGVALNRSHQQLVRRVQVHARQERVSLVALADREPLVELWDARRKGGLFEQAFGTRLTLRWQASASVAAPARGGLRVVGGRRRT